MLYGESHPGIAGLCNYIGASYEILGQIEKGLSYRLKALDIANCVKDEKKIAIYSNRIGKSYRSLGETNAANDYFRLAAEKYRELGDEEQAQENLKLIEE